MSERMFRELLKENREKLNEKIKELEAENAKLKLFFQDLSKKHSECTEGLLFTASDLMQAQAVLSLGVLGSIDAEAIALAIAAGRLGECNELRPIETAPKDGTWILLFGDSGYTTTPLRCEVCRYYPVYRPLQPWQNHANNSFLDGGGQPTHWMPLPDSPES